VRIVRIGVRPCLLPLPPRAINRLTREIDNPSSRAIALMVVDAVRVRVVKGLLSIPATLREFDTQRTGPCRHATLRGAKEESSGGNLAECNTSHRPRRTGLGALHHPAPSVRRSQPLGMKVVYKASTGQ
jgi:hypothetical protein